MSPYLNLTPIVPLSRLHITHVLLLLLELYAAQHLSCWDPCLVFLTEKVSQRKSLSLFYFPCRLFNIPARPQKTNMLWKQTKPHIICDLLCQLSHQLPVIPQFFRILQSQSKFPRPLASQKFLLKKIIVLFILVHMYGIYSCMHICSCALGYACSMAYEWRSDGDLRESVLSFYLVGPWGWTQVSGFDSKCPY